MKRSILNIFLTFSLIFLFISSSHATMLKTRAGEGELFLSKKLIDEYFDYVTQPRSKLPLLFFISEDQKDFYKIVIRNDNKGAAGASYIKKKIVKCERELKQKCHVFSNTRFIVWDNGINPLKKKHSKLSSKISYDEYTKKLNELGFINSNSKTKIAKVENTIFENNSNKTEEKDISEYIYMLNLIAPNSKLFFIEKNDPSQVIILNDTDIIKNRKLIKDYRFNEKTKLYELEYKNRKFIRVDPQLRITLKAKTQKTVAFDLGKNEIYKNLIREFNFRTNQFKNRKDYLASKSQIEELFSTELKSLKFVKKTDNKNQSVVQISASKDNQSPELNEVRVNAVICTFIKQRQTEYPNKLGLMVSVDKCPITAAYRKVKYKRAPSDYRHHLKKNLCYDTEINKIKMRSDKCKDNEFYLKYKNENNEDIFYYNSENKKINSELIAENKQNKVEEKIVNLESKTDIVKVVEPQQEEFKPKTKDIDNDPPVIEIAENITVNKPDFEIEGKILDNSDKIFIEIDGITSEVIGEKFKIKRYSPVDQQIKIVAIDKYGNRSNEKIINIRVDVKDTKVVDLEPLNPLKVKSEINSSSVALIIGIEKYENTPAAKYASLDAKYFTEYSKNIFGVDTKNIKLLTDEQANLSNTNSAIFKWLPSKIKENQTDLIIFYSGHGLASADGKSKYILPSNVDPDLLSRTALSRNEFFDQIISLKPKSVTIFFDTCYSGVSRDEEMLLASAKPLMIVAEDENKLPDNFTIFTASKPDQISSGLKEAKHGIFSYYLMKGLEGNADINKDFKITNGELLAYMNKNVSEKALDLGRQQNPLLFGNKSNVILTLN